MKKFLFFCFLCLLHGLATAQYSSLLWKITGKKIKQPSYLFGTMHSSDERVLKLAEFTKPYFQKTDAYAMELDPGEALNMNLLTKLMMGKNYSLKNMIPDKEYRFLDSIIRVEVEFSLMLLDNVAPVFTMTILEASAMGLKDSAVTGNNTEVLDLYFYKNAQQQNKKIVGIETVDEQLSALNTLSFQQQADLLVKEINSLQQNTNHGTALLNHYLNQNLDSLVAGDINTQMPEVFYQALVTDRNKRMATRIAAIIQKQISFIAVGALHLPGVDGIINLLRQQGFILEPIKN